MTIGYWVLAIYVMVAKADAFMPTIRMVLDSAFDSGAVFGGMMGTAFSYGVKRAVNSSGAGFGETPPSGATAETPHPATQGLVNSFSVYVDVLVCFCSGMMALVTDCFNVLGPDGKAYMYVGSGSSAMAEQAATNTAGVVWVQEAAKTAFGAGGSLVAIALTCFAYSTCIAYYYEGESGLAYLMKDTHPHLRKTGIWIIRILMPIFFFVWANVTATTAWAISEVMFGLMAWFNLIALLLLLPVVKKTYDDYIAQHNAGVEMPYFNPEKLGIENCDLWMDINKDRIDADTKRMCDQPAIRH